MDFRARLKETTVTSIVTYILFAVAVVLADIMYLQLATRVVDSGLLILAIAGAFALGGSALILPRKLKNGDIKPGARWRSPCWSPSSSSWPPMWSWLSPRRAATCPRASWPSMPPISPPSRRCWPRWASC